MTAYQTIVEIDAKESLSDREPPMIVLDAILELQALGYRHPEPNGPWVPPQALIDEVRADSVLREHVFGRVWARWPESRPTAENPDGVAALSNADMLLQACVLQTAVDEYRRGSIQEAS